MSVLKTLTENIVKRNLQRDGTALLNKWEKTGLLEGLDDDYKRNSLAVLLENQAKELLREATTMAGGDVEGYAAVAFPIVRRVFGGLIANDLVSVQPMSLPSGLVFFLDFTKQAPETYGLNELRDGSPRRAEGRGDSIYGGGTSGSGILGGLTDITDEGGGIYNLRQGHTASRGAVNGAALTFTDPQAAATGADIALTAVGLANNDASMGQNAVSAADRVIVLNGQLTETEQQALGFDADLLAETGGTECAIFRVRYMNAANAAAALGTQAGATAASHPEGFGAAGEPSAFDKCMGVHEQFTAAAAGQMVANPGGGRGGLSHIALTQSDGTALAGCTALPLGVRMIRRLTRVVTASAVEPGIAAGACVAGSRYLEIVLVAGPSGSGAQFDATAQAGNGVTGGGAGGIVLAAISFAKVDNQTTGNVLGTNAGANAFEMEDSVNLPEIDVQVDSAAITAATRKLKARWTPELAQDLNAYHNLDAEVELTGVLSEHIALEIDQEILGDLIKGATAGSLYWSRRPGLFINRNTGADITNGGLQGPDFTGTVSEWYETLIETVNDVSASIHRKTLRGGANFLVCGPEVANILEFTSGFRASVTHDDDKGSVGAVSAGSINKKWDLIVDPYFPRNVILVGRKGGSFLESGYVYAPYVPLQVTPTIFDPDNFTPRKAVMTRYGKRMVNPDMYGLVLVRDL